MLHDPFGRDVRPPADLDRAGRVRLLHDAAEALLRHELPHAAARAFVGSGLQAWLASGGDLTGTYWSVTAPRGSHLTPSRVWRTLIDDERQAGDPVANSEHDDT